MAETKIKTETPLQDQAPPPWVVELLRALKPQGPLEVAGLSPERIAAIKDLPAPQRYREIPWQSEDTGATGIAHVIEARDKTRFPHGRIVSIAEYTHPPEAYIFQSQEGPSGKAGMVPNGFHMWKDAPRLVEGKEPQQGDLNAQFLQWRYDTFYKADLARYSGKSITQACCHPDGAGLKTAWSESRVGAISEA